MDHDALRNSFMAAKKVEENPFEARKREIMEKAQAVQAAFAKATDPEERRQLQQQYDELDRELGAVNEAKDAEAREKAEAAAAAREREAAFRHNVSGDDLADPAEKIEKGRKNLLENSKMGAGDATHKRIRDELNYLLNNYLPANDWRIEMLIDKWRRSGDPSYDAIIKVKYRNVRKERDDSQSPL